MYKKVERIKSQSVDEKRGRGYVTGERVYL